MTDKDRLIKRTQLKRSEYRILGKSEEENESDEEQRQRELEVSVQYEHIFHCLFDNYLQFREMYVTT